MNTSPATTQLVASLPIVILARALRDAFFVQERRFVGLPARA